MKSTTESSANGMVLRVSSTIVILCYEALIVIYEENARALYKKCPLMTVPPEPLVQIQNKFTELFLKMNIMFPLMYQYVNTLVNSFLARGDFCYLLITFTSSLDPDQD